MTCVLPSGTGARAAEGTASLPLLKRRKSAYSRPTLDEGGFCGGGMKRQRLAVSLLECFEENCLSCTVEVTPHLRSGP